MLDRSTICASKLDMKDIRNVLEFDHENYQHIVFICQHPVFVVNAELVKHEAHYVCDKMMMMRGRGVMFCVCYCVSCLHRSHSSCEHDSFLVL